MFIKHSLTQKSPKTNKQEGHIMSIRVDDFNIGESSPEEEDTSSSEQEQEGRRRRGRPIRKGKKKAAPKPPNPFILFSLENRQRIADENKDVSNAEISRLLGVAWRKLHPDEKKKYKKKAAEAKESQQEPRQNIEYLAPLYFALYEANIGLNTLSGLTFQQ
eukprot:Phypoly_transcript_19479.p1 GENE.Phypoly_transcript_19479~~Phypoly_transcript_19479.p1  ORF type:complete len:161 (+),score=28.68 Phypoly_transcript_19479:46-528(+)